MATNELDVRISLKRDSASNWSTKNPKLLDGELVVVNDTAGPRLKVGDGNSNYTAIPFLDAAATSHIENKSNPHGVTKAQLNLGNVDNTADSAKTVKAAGALTVVSKGSATKPVYFNASGVPVPCTYSLNADVPSGAKFTDTVYTHPDTHAATMITGLAAVATSGSYNDLSNKPTIPTSLPANGGNAATVGGFTVGTNVPADAVFTDTIYTLPAATTSALGGVKVGTNISVSSGTISVANGSTSAKGVVQLTNSTSSTSTTTAATPAAVKSAYDLANGKQSPATTLSGYGITDAYTKTEVDTKVAGLVDSAPEALNTLNELAAALGDDPNFATTMSTAIGKKANTADLAKVATSGNYNDLSNKPTIPTSLPANGGNAATVGGFTVGTNVPADAVFTDTVYTHPTYTAKSSGLYKITVNNLGHVSAATAVAKADITGLGIPAQDTVYTHPNSGVAAGTYRSVTVNAQGHVTSGSNPTTTVAQGGTGATSDEGARKNLKVNIKTYTNYSQLGLSETPADMPALLAAIPNESNFIKQFSSSYEQFGLPFEGTLIIFKASYGEAMLWLTSAYSTNWRMAFGHATASGAVTWRDPSFLENGVLPITSGGTGANSAAGILTNLGVTATAAELNYVDGVTSNIQTQLNGKLSTSGKAASATVADSANAVAWTNVSGKPTIPTITKVTFTASDSKWGALANGRYPLTISASGGEFLNCYRTNGSNYDKMDVNVTVSGNNIIIYSLDKFAGYVTYIK